MSKGLCCFSSKLISTSNFSHQLCWGGWTTTAGAEVAVEDPVVAGLSPPLAEKGVWLCVWSVRVQSKKGMNSFLHILSEWAKEFVLYTNFSPLFIYFKLIFIFHTDQPLSTNPCVVGEHVLLNHVIDSNLG